MNEFILEVPGHPPSVNRVWRKFGNRMVKSKDYIEWEQDVAAVCLMRGNLAYYKTFAKKRYSLDLKIVDISWDYKNGNPKKPDLTNFIKAAEDAVCKVYGWDDVYCMSLHVSKVIGDSAKTVYHFSFFDEV
jgi:Holliday junction resolvase RusA-like endonuclease